MILTRRTSSNCLRAYRTRAYNWKKLKLSSSLSGRNAKYLLDYDIHRYYPYSSCYSAQFVQVLTPHWPSRVVQGLAHYTTGFTDHSSEMLQVLKIHRALRHSKPFSGLMQLGNNQLEGIAKDFVFVLLRAIAFMGSRLELMKLELVRSWCSCSSIAA